MDEDDSKFNACDELLDEEKPEEPKSTSEDSNDSVDMDELCFSAEDEIEDEDEEYTDEDFADNDDDIDFGKELFESSDFDDD